MIVVGKKNGPDRTRCQRVNEVVFFINEMPVPGDMQPRE